IGQIASTALANARLLTALERTSRLKSEFVSTVSHELRTPLNVILGNAEMLDDSHTAPAEREVCAAAIRRAGRELLDMVENTLEVGKLEAGRSRASLTEIPLSELWAELQRSCADLARRPGVVLEWGEIEDRGAVTTDPRKLATVLKNLVGNALKFTARGAVRVTLRRRGDALELCVADTGIGIAPERHGEVFEMFRQVDGSDSRAYDGAGLGLYIVERFVRELGGSVALQSELGQGATFTVSLP